MVALICTNIIRKTIFVLLGTLFFVSMMTFSNEKNRLKAGAKVTLSTLALQARVEKAMSVEQARDAAMRKIIGIIDSYNEEMSVARKMEIASVIYEMSVKYDNLDVDLICATITHESALTWDPSIVSPAGALGLMQIMPYMGAVLCKNEGLEWTGAKQILFDPVNNIRMGSRYLSSLIELYEIDGGLAAYNGGTVRAAKWLASGRDNDVLYEETRGYVPAILKLYASYRN